ncbi:hypothetical protein GCK72_011449 [Caenorhabditis remanei]|nr:hypothetical protein GCK72_011449 [Caenorhabditis remanei]KAF1763183.1 hypothetical protein GCK72_011449 [Caenorhabditis remanei]
MAFGPPKGKRTVVSHFLARYELATHNAVDMVYVAAQPGNFYPAEHVQTNPTIVTKIPSQQRTTNPTIVTTSANRL